MFKLETDGYVVITKDDNYHTSLCRYLDRIDLINKFVYVIYFEDLMPTINMNPQPPDVTWMFEHIQYYKSNAEQNHKKFIILVDGGWEGPTYRHNLKHGIDEISSKFNIPTDDMIIYGGAHSQFDDPIKFCVSIDMSFSQDTFRNTDGTTLPDYHFISLARIAKPHRVYATVEMLERGLDKVGNLSLGCGYYSNHGENFDLRLVPEKFKDRMPLYIDGPVVGVARDQQHVAVDDRFTKSFINVVMETSYDATISPFTWNSHMISEKTTKAFAWGQVPLFIALCNSVQYLRDYGFDVFDDIIDHNYYDNEPDPMLRIKKAIDQLEKICSWSIDKCREYKQANMKRFLSNRELAERYQEYKKSDTTFNNLKTLFDSI